MFKGTGVSVSGSVWSVGGSASIASVRGKVNLGVGNISVTGNRGKVLMKVSVGEIGGELSVSSASIKTGVLVVEAKAIFDKNASVDFESVSADAKVQAGDNSNVKMDDNTEVSVGVKVGALKTNLAIDFKFVNQWFRGTLNTFVEILTPEINIKTNKYNYLIMKLFFYCIDPCINFLYTDK